MFHFMEDGKKVHVPFLRFCIVQRSDITICILKDGKVLYEKMIPASKTDCVTIDLSEFEPGTYTVGLKNQWDDCLWGEFYANYDKKWSYDQNCIGC